jgi:hypothetical protein
MPGRGLAALTSTGWLKVRRAGSDNSSSEPWFGSTYGVKTPESSHRMLATMTDEIPGPGNVPLDPDDNPDVPDAEDPNAPPDPDSDPDDET